MLTPMLSEVFFRYAIGDDDAAYNQEAMVADIYRIYISENQDQLRRVGLPPLSELKYYGLRDFMVDPFYPDELKVTLLARIKLEKPELAEQLKEQEQLFIKTRQQQREKQQQDQK